MKLGFIGGGALAEAVIKGIADQIVAAEDIFVSDIRSERVEELNARYHVNASVDKAVFLDKIDTLLIAVKPKDAQNALKELGAKLDPNVLVISVVAGLRLEVLEKFLPSNPIIRVMPNVAISVGESMTALARGTRVDDNQLESIEEFFSALGRCTIVDERLMDAVTGLSGSGPAFAFLMIDALSDGGVAAGLPRGAAIELAAQTLLGAAKMVLGGEHPDVLRDRVTSPAGTTIEGVRMLERSGVRSALIEAVIAASEKSKSLGH